MHTCAAARFRVNAIERPRTPATGRNNMKTEWPVRRHRYRHLSKRSMRSSSARGRAPAYGTDRTNVFGPGAPPANNHRTRRDLPWLMDSVSLGSGSQRRSDPPPTDADPQPWRTYSLTSASVTINGVTRTFAGRGATTNDVRDVRDTNGPVSCSGGRRLPADGADAGWLKPVSGRGRQLVSARDGSRPRWRDWQ